MKTGTSPLEILGENLKRLRLARQLTQQTTAEKSGLSYKHYQALESARLENPTYPTIEKLSELFGVEYWQLFHPAAFPKPKIQKISPHKIRR